MNEDYEKLNQKFLTIKKEVLDLKKNLNTSIYDFSQLNVWFFLATMAAVSISEEKYRVISLGMTGVLFFYQVFLFGKLKMNFDINSIHINDLKNNLDKIQIKINNFEYIPAEKKESRKHWLDGEVSFGKFVIFPMFLNIIFYIYILNSYLK